MSDVEDSIEACGKCGFLLMDDGGEIEGVQCKECTQWFHLNCVQANAFQLYLMTSGYKQTMTCVACVEAALGKEGLRDAVKALRKKVKTEAEWLATLKRELAENEETLIESENNTGVENNGKDKPSSLETNPAQIKVPEPSGKPTEATKQVKKQAGEPKRKKAPLSREDKLSKRKTKLCRHFAYNLCKKKDAECDFIHPKACKKALQKQPCFNQQCTLFHFRQEYNLKGGMKSNDKTSGNKHFSQANQSSHGKPGKRGNDSNPQRQGQGNAQSLGRNMKRNGNVKNLDFLYQLQDLLQNLIQTLQ